MRKIYALLLVLFVFIAGCGTDPSFEAEDEAYEEIKTSFDEAVEETLDVESVDDDLSVDEEEDWGDII
jgi:PBP1b-binding outer membrane lipoprotein LpoB